jgi:Cu(I)/Ag(I) efflux system membrane fusion protein
MKKFLIISVLALIISCRQKEKPAEVHQAEPISGIKLDDLLNPTNEFVVSSIPVTTIQPGEEQLEIESLGKIAYDTRTIGSVSSRIAGRIEKLYVRYRYQKVSKGQKIMDIYSPELVTEQQNLLFLVKNDPNNATMINAAKARLNYLGMSNAQVEQVIRNNKPSMSVSVFSNYSGHIHETIGGGMQKQAEGMNDLSLLTEELQLKEGMYVQKGQSVFTLYDPSNAWAILNVYGDAQMLIKKGDAARVTPEAAPGKDFRGTIQFIEPYLQKESKTITVRVPFDNSQLKIPVGSQVRATIFGDSKKANWLPSSAVLSLGIDQVVFLKEGNGFRAKKIRTGLLHNNRLQVLEGLSSTDSVAVNAQFLSDSESFIRTNN